MRFFDPARVARVALTRNPARGATLPLLLAALLLCVLSPPVVGQSSDAGSAERPPLLPRAREVALARSAAPPEVSDAAAVLVLERGKGFVLAEPGTNGVTCLVDRSWPQAIEPHCYDPEGTRTILPIRLREMELREAGMSKSEIQADVAEGFRTGRFVVPSRPAVTWMMSAEQVLVSDEGRRVGAWKPHLMIYFPFLQPADLGLGEAPPRDGPMLSDPGRPTANLVIVMPSFVPVRGPNRGAVGLPGAYMQP